MFDRLDGVGTHAEAVALAKGIAQQVDRTQVRQETMLALVVGVTDPVSNLYGFASQLAAAGHFELQYVDCPRATGHGLSDWAPAPRGVVL